MFGLGRKNNDLGIAGRQGLDFRPAGTGQRTRGWLTRQPDP